MSDASDDAGRRDDGLDRRSFLRRSALGAGVAGAFPAALAACGGSGAGDAPSNASAQDGAPASRGLQGEDPRSVGRKRIGLVVLIGAPEVVQRWVQTARRTAEEGGWDLQYTDANGDINKATQAWQNYLQSGVDGLIAAGLDPSQWGPQIRAAESRKVPYISIYTSWVPGVAANISSNYFDEGTQLASFIVDHTGGQGNVVVLNSRLIPALHVRELALEAVLKAVAPDMRIVARHELNLAKVQQDANDAMSALLQRYPEGEIAAVFGGWDGASLSAASAIEKAGRTEIVAVGTDGDKAALDSLRDGGVHAATTAPNFEAVGVQAIRQMAQALADGRPMGKQIYVQSPVITAANVPQSGYAEGPSEVFTFSPWES